MVGCKGKDCVATKSRIEGVLKQEAVIGKNRRKLSNVIGNFVGTPCPVVRVQRIGVFFKEDEYPKAPRKNTSSARVHRTVTRKLSAIIGNIFGPTPYVTHRRGLSEKFAEKKTGKYHHQTQVQVAVEWEKHEGGLAGETFMDYRPSKMSNGSPHPDPIVEKSLSPVQPPEPTYKEDLACNTLGSMEKGGVGALELVAMDKKARGMYFCRTLSDKGAEIVEVPLEANMMEIKPQTEDLTIIKEDNEKIDPMEVDMDDICDDDESVLDIDVAERKNPLAVTEYIDDIFQHYKRTEYVVPKYMAQQDDINERARGVLVDWLIEIHYKMKLLDETLYLTVNILDRFLALQRVSRKHIQLVGAASLVLACKYEEGRRWVINDVISLCNNALCRQSILQTEKVIINILNFNFSLPTPFVFANRFLRAAKCDKKLEVLSFFLLEICLIDYQMLRFPPSLLVAASIFTAECTLKGNDKEWTKTLESYTGYCREDLMECSKKMVHLHHMIGSSHVFCSVMKKYCSKFGGFATPTPAFFLLD